MRKQLFNAEKKNLLRTKFYKGFVCHYTPSMQKALMKEALFRVEYEKVKRYYGEEKAKQLLGKYEKEAYSRPDVINSEYITNRLRNTVATQE